MDKYTFSYYADGTKPILKRRKWWNLFGRDTLEIIPITTRKCFTDLSKEQAEILKMEFNRTMDTNRFSHLQKLLLKLMGNNIVNIQLEIDKPYSPYVATSGSEYVDVTKFLPKDGRRHSLLNPVKYL